MIFVEKPVAALRQTH